MKRVGIYPGTFDPVTNGHIDIIKRASYLVDKLIVGIAENTAKNTMFSAKERESMVSNEIENLAKDNVEVQTFSGLLADFAKSRNISMIVRGLRVGADFEYEFQMNCINGILAPDVQTILLFPSEGMQFVSSSFIKQISKLGGNISKFVSQNVREVVEKKNVS